MIVTLTGTPGTGKSSVAEHLDWRVIDLTNFVKGHELGEVGEEFHVDVESMVEALREEIDRIEQKNILIEGHLSHHFPSDYCVVLRCNPEELEGRIQERNYPEEKVKENLEAEKLDVILSEAVEEQDKIIEIDTTDRESDEVTEELRDRIKNNKTGYGEIDWSDYL